MTEQDKLYIQSHRLWLQANKHNIDEHQMSLEHNESRLKIIQKQAELDEIQLKNCLDYRAAAIEDFNGWCKINEIDTNQV